MSNWIRAVMCQDELWWPPAEFVKYIKVIWIWLKVGFCNSPVRYSPSRSASGDYSPDYIVLCCCTRDTCWYLAALCSKQYLWLNLCHQHVSRSEMIGQYVSLQLYTNPTLRFADQSCQGQRFLLILVNTWWNTEALTMCWLNVCTTA